MTVQKQFGKAVAWMALGNWTEQAVNFIVFVTLARLLGAEAFGLLAMAAVFVIFSEFLVRETLSEALISLPDIDDGHLNASFWSLTVFGLGLGAVIVLGAGLIGAFYDEPRIVPLVQTLALSVPIIAVTAVPVTILRRKMEFRILSLRAIAGVIAGGIVGIAMAMSGAGVWALVGQRLVQVGVNVVLAWGAVAWRPRFNVSLQMLRDTGGLGVQVLLLRVGEIALTQLPVLIIGAVLGPISAGIYSIAWRLVELASVLIAMPIRMAAQPAFAAINRQGEKAAEFLVDLIRLAGWLAFPAFAGLSVLALPFLASVFGDKWLAAAPVLMVMAPLGAYLSVEKQHQAFSLAKGRAGALAVLTWVEAAAIAVVIYVVLPRGLDMATLAQILVLGALWPIRFVVIARMAGISALELARPHVAPVVSCLIMAGLVAWSLDLWAGLPDQGKLVLGGAMGVVIYGVLTLAIMRDRFALAASYVSVTRGKTDSGPVGRE
jgi:O-antigen/teichoic acid export membrane protein